VCRNRSPPPLPSHLHAPRRNEDGVKLRPRVKLRQKTLCLTREICEYFEAEYFACLICLRCFLLPWEDAA
jgi:hypothetical protein